MATEKQIREREAGAKLLGFHPLPLLRIACRKCPRYGQYRTARLLERFGPDAKLPDVQWALFDCPKRKDYGDYCGAYFPDLLALDIAENGPINSAAASSAPRGSRGGPSRR